MISHVEKFDKKIETCVFWVINYEFHNLYMQVELIVWSRLGALWLIFVLTCHFHWKTRFFKSFGMTWLTARKKPLTKWPQRQKKFNWLVNPSKVSGFIIGTCLLFYFRKCVHAGFTGVCQSSSSQSSCFSLLYFPLGLMCTHKIHK